MRHRAIRGCISAWALTPWRKEIEIVWPSGIRQVLRDVAADRIVTVTEPSAGKAPPNKTRPMAPEP